MKKLKAKKKPSAKSYLFDISEWQHFTDTVLPDWINRGADGEIAATTIEELLIKPLKLLCLLNAFSKPPLRDYAIEAV